MNKKLKETLREKLLRGSMPKISPDISFGYNTDGQGGIWLYLQKADRAGDGTLLGWRPDSPTSYRQTSWKKAVDVLLAKL